MGELTLRLPRRIGVRVTMDKFLSSFEPAGLVRRGDAFQSSNYDSTQRHVDLDVSTAIGGINVDWVE
jgi:predicted membrane protein